MRQEIAIMPFQKEKLTLHPPAIQHHHSQQDRIKAQGQPNVKSQKARSDQVATDCSKT